MRHSQRGAVLIVSLLLLAVATVVGIAGINNSQLGERVASNQKQASEAFMAAESGLVRAKVWFDDPGNAGLWGDSVATLAAINGMQQSLQNSAQWQLESVDYDSNPGFALIVSVGTIGNTGVTRKVQALYQQAKASGNLAAMNIIGNIKTFDTANSNSFEIIGELDAQGNAVGPALATNTDANVELMETDINSKDRMDNYKGGIKKVEFDDPFGDPEKMSQFITALKAEYFALPVAARGIAPNNMGTVAAPRITYHSGALQLKGNNSGAGILVVEGNLSFSGTPSFEGLIIVTGQTFTISGGGNGGVLGGAVVFANPLQDANTGEWSFGQAEATFVFDVDGGGKATFRYDKESLETARDLLSENGVAQQMWQLDSSAGSSAATPSSMSSWSEVY
jgi:Tfp pilus assembly protein PilX